MQTNETPKNLRSDFNHSRSKKLYEEYASNNTSYNKLALKYKISPQRVRYLINDYKQKGLHGSLLPTASAQQRDAVKNSAIVLREQGKQDIAVQMFDEVIAWDAHNNNLKGKMDILGHKKIALLQLADKSTLSKKKLDYLNAAYACIEESIKIGQQTKLIPVGSVAIQQVHLASLLDRLAENSPKNEALNQRLKALKILKEAINVFPGSKAHLAWPMSIQARILYLAGKSDQAIETLYSAQTNLAEGYDDELKNGDQAALKLRVWSSGIELALAKIYIDTKKYILAEIHLAAVLNTYDPDKTLANRKREAKSLLVECKRHAII